MTITEYLENAIQSLGHELFAFEDRQHVIPGRIRNVWPFLQRLDLAIINKRLLARAQEFKPQIAIVTGGHRISPDTLEKLKHQGVRRILWTTDAPLNFQPIIEAAPHYDHIFCQGSEANDLLAAAGIKDTHWLPMACDPAYHHPVDVTGRERELYACDLAFVGSFYPNRAELLDKLVDFDLGIWGPGWNSLPKECALKARIRGLQVTPDVWTKIYSVGKIVLVPHYQDPARRIPVHQASPKVFEAMACGAFVISDNQRDVCRLFQKGVHIEIFYDPDDLKQKLRYHLNHPEARVKIARQGRKQVLSRHTYKMRIEELLGAVCRTCQDD